ncbi:histidine kinase [Nocardioides convexus]|uniref:sensor histidine kinase n=1 Tax=Nocardioides convexus TaxID=2712224 RepID=UPI0024182B9E|nr:histidine kinase [Nocardioides convexus]
MRALVAERAARERAWDQATTAERERIAREIHDLVAHSLSISLLQVTGARRALRDVTGSAEAVAEVDAALADAEQVGRRAMTDIRRTVSAMADGSADRHPLPGGGDIAALVREMSGAGLAVEYDEQGDPASLPAATGLGLYRIVQESLANVARHGGTDARAHVRLRVAGGGAHLRITNPLPAGRPRGDGLGSGLAGMQARAAQAWARAWRPGRTRTAGRSTYGPGRGWGCPAAARCGSRASCERGPGGAGRRPGGSSARGCGGSCAAATASRSSPSAETAARCRPPWTGWRTAPIAVWTWW